MFLTHPAWRPWTATSHRPPGSLGPRASAVRRRLPETRPIVSIATHHGSNGMTTAAGRLVIRHQTISQRGRRSLRATTAPPASDDSPSLVLAPRTASTTSTQTRIGDLVGNWIGHDDRSFSCLLRQCARPEYRNGIDSSRGIAPDYRRRMMPAIPAPNRPKMPPLRRCATSRHKPQRRSPRISRSALACVGPGEYYRTIVR